MEFSTLHNETLIYITSTLYYNEIIRVEHNTWIQNAGDLNGERILT